MGCRQHPPSMIKMEYMSLDSITDIHSPSRRALPTDGLCPCRPLSNERGKLTATLSDGSAPAYVDTSLGDTVDTSHGKEAYYSITYKAGSPGQSLTVTWTNTTNSGNVTIQGVALGTAALGSIVGALTIPAGSNINLTAQAQRIGLYGGMADRPILRPSSVKVPADRRSARLQLSEMEDTTILGILLLPCHGQMEPQRQACQATRMESTSLESITDIRLPFQQPHPAGRLRLPRSLPNHGGTADRNFERW